MANFKMEPCEELGGDGFSVYPGHPITIAYLIVHNYTSYAEATKVAEGGHYAHALASSDIPGAGSHVRAALDFLQLLVAGVRPGVSDPPSEAVWDNAVRWADLWWNEGKAGGHEDAVKPGQEQAELVKPRLYAVREWWEQERAAPPWREPHLIQRLKPPFKWTIPGTMTPGEVFGFGGGGSGLTKEALELLRPIWDWDYMGAAEYEFGAAQGALYRLVGWRGALTRFSFQIEPEKFKRPWWIDRELKRRRTTATKKKALTQILAGFKPITIYAICHQKHSAEVEKVVRAIAADKHQLRDTTCLEYLALPEPGRAWTSDVCGWLALEQSPFLFFVDERMYKMAFELLKEGKCSKPDSPSSVPSADSPTSTSTSPGSSTSTKRPQARRSSPGKVRRSKNS